MPRDRNDNSTPRGWLARARSNLARARQPKPEEVFWEDLCFDAQQALLFDRTIPFRFVHDIGELLDSLGRGGVQVPEDVLESAELTVYAVAARYPGPVEPVTAEDAKEAAEVAERVVDWVASLIDG